MKRVFLLIVTNLAVMLVLGLVVSLLGVDRYLTTNGLDLQKLLAFAAVMGFGGSFISLWMSKGIAKMSTGAKVIESPQTQEEMWLLETVHRLAQNAGLPNPEVAVYEGDPNAFATGPSKSNALVAVSTGLMRGMTRDEVEAVLAHEISHVANGDMVTLTLIQGIVNTFVFFFARVVGTLIDGLMRGRNSEDEQEQAPIGHGFGYMATVMVCELVFGVLASMVVMAFSRRREYRADAGAAGLTGGPQPMIAALKRLGGLHSGALPQNMAAFGIVDGGKLMSLFASHPSIEARIAALEAAAGKPAGFGPSRGSLG